MEKKKILIIFLIVVTIALGLLEFVQINDYYNSVNNCKNDSIENYTNYYNTIIYMYKINAKTYYEEVISSNKEILDIMERANYADEQEKDILRKRLIDILDYTYNNAIMNQFRQFQFHLVDFTSFARMHAPESYGDNLKEIRPTIVMANEGQKYVEGFEEGRIFNGYRFVYPLFNEGRFIGTEETSISYSSVIKAFNDLFNIKGYFIIKKDVVEEKVWEEYLDNYVDCNIIEGYLCDREIYEYFSCNQNNYDLMKKISLKVKEEIIQLEKTEESFVINTKIDGKNHLLTFIAIDNIYNERAAYLIFTGKNVMLDYYDKVFLINSLLVLLLWIISIIIYFVISWNSNRIEELIVTDTLTNAYNRKKFYEIIEAEIKRKDRYENNITLIMYDIDRFKKINDEFGHNSGDIVLKELTKLVKGNIRETDYLFRWGGEEFIIILFQTKLSEAVEVAEKLRRIIENFHFSVEGLNKVTVSFGVAEYRSEQSVDDLVNNADQLLYEAKRAGRNQVKF
ncbi:MAG: diguanylate cyclase [Vulcanibacillus sp.]